MRYTMEEHSQEEKALMFDLITDTYLEYYNSKEPVPRDFGSRAAQVGYEVLVMLMNNGFLTKDGIHEEKRAKE